MEHFTAEQLVAPSETDLINQAELVTDWVLDTFLIGELNEREIPEPSAIAAHRLANIFGNAEPVEEHLRKLVNVLDEIPEEHHGNVLLYCTGYPADAIDALADGDIKESLELVHKASLPLRVEAPHQKSVPESQPIRDLIEDERIASKGRVATKSLAPSYEATVLVARSSLTEEQLKIIAEYEAEQKYLKWEDDALCAQTDPEMFFPEKGGSTKEAKKICTSCEVREQCLTYALANDERFGIWGGLSERERRKFKKRTAPKTSE